MNNKRYKMLLFTILIIRLLLVQMLSVPEKVDKKFPKMKRELLLGNFLCVYKKKY